MTGYANFMAVFFAVLLLVCGAVFAAMPFLTRGREVFAVTVPASAQSDPAIRELKRTYALLVGAATVVCVAVVVAVGAATQWSLVAMRVMVGVTIALSVGAYALMLVFRSRVRALKGERGWKAEVAERVAVVGSPAGGPLPQPVPMRANLVYIPIVLATLVLCVALYPQMPDQIPMHVDFSGNVTSYSEKSPATVGFALGMQVFMAAIMAFTHFMILRSKRPVEPESPAESALAYALYARAWSLAILLMGVVLCLCLALLPLTMAGLMSLAAWGALMVVVVLVILAVFVVLGVRYGQNGARAIRSLRPREADSRMRADDDAMWKAGVFYWNPADPAVVVPKRFGIGWTINWARPLSWAIIAGLVLAVVLLVWFSIYVTVRG